MLGNSRMFWNVRETPIRDISYGRIPLIRVPAIRMSPEVGS